MIRSFFNIGLILLLFVLGTACSDQQPDSGGNSLVSPQFLAAIQTRASNTTWDVNDAIGITMLYALPGTESEYINEKYSTPDGNGVFTPAQDPIYLPQDGSGVKFKAYYPYDGTIGNNLQIPVDISDQTNLPAIDLMTAEPVDVYSKNTPEVTLAFQHRLTKLTCIIQSKAGISWENIDKFCINRITTTATYHLLEGELRDQDGLQEVTLCSTSDWEYEAIILPQESTDDLSLTITLKNGDDYTAKIDENILPALEPGTHYKFTLTLEDNDLKLGVIIVPWIEGDPYNGALILETTNIQNSGAIDRDKLYAYQKLQSNNNRFTRITTFTYDAVQDFWFPDPVVYWSDMVSYQEGVFRGYIIRKEAYNATQLPEIIVSGDVVIEKGNTIQLELKRAVSQLVFSLKSSNNEIAESSLRNMEITLHDFQTGGDIDAEGAFIPGDEVKDIEVARNVGVNNASSIAIIQPQTVQAGVRATIKGQGDEAYEVTFSEQEFKAGETRHITIVINKSAVTMGVKIVDWQTGEGIPLTASMSISGTLEGTPDFFEDKNIQIYEMTTYIREQATASYKFSDDRYSWEVPAIYWEDVPDMRATLAAIHYPGLDSTNLPDPEIDRYNSVLNWKMSMVQLNGYDTYDLLWSRPKLYTREIVNLEFEHAMSKIVLNLKPGEGITDDDLKGLSVNIMASIEGEVDIVEATVTSTSGKIQVAPYQEDPDIPTYSCLVFPQTISAGEVFIMLMQGNDANSLLLGSLANDLVLVSGKEHLITVTVNKTTMQLSATLKDWETGDSGEVTIQ